MPLERVAELLREYDASGLTQAAFARRVGVKYPTFAGWVHARRAQGSRGPSRSSGVRFAQVELPAPNAPAAELSVMLPDGVLVRGGDIQTLAALVRALRS